MSMKSYTDAVNPATTPQSEALPGREAEMQENHAGGFSFVLDDWARLDRFLVLGSDGPTYYQSGRKLTKENAACAQRCVAEDGLRTVKKIVEISTEGRAPKNDPALFALAMCAGLGDDATRREALKALPRVARIGTLRGPEIERVRRGGATVRVE